MDSLNSEAQARDFLARFMSENPEFKRPYQIPPIPPPHPVLIDPPDRNYTKIEFLENPIPTFWEFNPNKYSYFLQMSTSKKYLSPNEIRILIANPRLAPVNLQMEPKEGGAASPAHLPNIEDLREIDPAAAASWMEWQSQVQDTVTTIIEESLGWVIDPAPILPQMRRGFTLTAESIQLKIRALANSLYTSQMQREFKQIEVTGKRWWDEESGRNMVSVMMKPLEHTLYSWEAGKFVTQETCSEEMWANLQKLPPIIDPMTVLVWNASGIGRPSFKTNVMHLYKSELPNFVFITETKSSIKHDIEVNKEFPLDKQYVVEPMGLSGGIYAAFVEFNLGRFHFY